jgi:uncharacterized protein YndB with AHSA1/START domain
MARYRFLTTWCFDAPLAVVWEAIKASERWPEWWPGVLRNECVHDGDGDGVGSVYECEWRSALPYTVRFRAETLRVEQPHAIEVRASGELAGRGLWRLYEGDGSVAIYEWDVETTPAWMNALAPFGRPVFTWNHDRIMRRGGEALARKLGCRLLAAD